MARETSIEAFNAVVQSGAVSKRRRMVYALLYAQGPLTGAQASQVIPGAWKRLAELRDIHLVREVGSDACPTSGHRAILWDVTACLPVKQERLPRLSRRQLEYRLSSAIEENAGLRAELAKLRGGFVTA